MSFINDDDFKNRSAINLAPMIDFLFLLLMFFACLAVTRVATKDTEIDLVEIQSKAEQSSLSEQPAKIITITVNAKGEYQWVTDVRDYLMVSAEDIAHELQQQYEKGLLDDDKKNTHVVLKIDKRALWEPIMRLIFAIRDAGFDAHPLYEPEKVSTT